MGEGEVLGCGCVAVSVFTRIHLSRLVLIMACSKSVNRSSTYVDRLKLVRFFTPF